MKAKKLKNGMRYHLIPYRGTEAATILVLVKVGSRYEPTHVWGGSHFIEHMMFKGTKRHPKTIDISKKLDRFGAQYNAYTSKDRTGYYVKIDGEQVPVAVDLLYDMLFHSTYKTSEFNRERSVIIEEIKMYEENPIMHVEDLIEQAMFQGNPLGLEIAGTAESIMATNKRDLIAYRDAYYIPSQMVVVMAGNIPKNSKDLLEKTFGTVRAQEQEPQTYLPFGDMPERKTPRIMRQQKPLKQIQIAIGFPTKGIRDKDRPAIRLLESILGGTMSSRLFIEVREKRGLCYMVRASSDVYEDVGMFMIRAGLDANRLPEALKTIFRELRKIKRDGVSAQELRYAKDNEAGSMKLQMENSSKRAEYVGVQELFLGHVQSIEERLKQTQRVTRSDIQRVAKEIFNMRKLSVAVVGPYASDAALRKHIPVLG